MKRWLIVAEGTTAGLFDPLDLVRPPFMIRNGVWCAAERWTALLQPAGVTAATRPALADVLAEESQWAVNSPPPEDADDVWIVAGVANPDSDLRWDELSFPAEFRWSGAASEVMRLSGQSWKDHCSEISAWVQSGGQGAFPSGPPPVGESLPIHDAAGPWDLIANLEDQLRFDAALWARLPSHARYEKPLVGAGSHIVGQAGLWCGRDVRIAPGAVVDCSTGPVILDDGAVVEPFTHLSGPAYVGIGTVLLGGKFSGGTAIGPGCKIGGEWEASVAQGFANKAHAGFFGHGFLGEWVNLGAMTTNSDLKNNYGTVRVQRQNEAVDTGRIKVGSFIADHTKTGIGTLLPTGASLGVGVNVFGGGLCPGSMPSFVWAAPGHASEHRIDKMLATARTTVSRRAAILEKVGRAGSLTASQSRLLRSIFTGTAEQRHAFLSGGT